MVWERCWVYPVWKSCITSLHCQVFFIIISLAPHSHMRRPHTKDGSDKNPMHNSPLLPSCIILLSFLCIFPHYSSYFSIPYLSLRCVCPCFNLLQIPLFIHMDSNNISCLNLSVIHLGLFFHITLYGIYHSWSSTLTSWPYFWYSLLWSSSDPVADFLIPHNPLS